MQPLRCWTCGRSLHRALKDFPLLTSRGMTPEAALNHLGLVRYCCRRFPLADHSYAPALETTPEEDGSSESHTLTAPEGSERT